MKYLFFSFLLLISIDCLSQSYLSPAYTPTEVRPSFNWRLAQQVVAKKERNYDNNLERISSFINSATTGLDNSSLDKTLIRNVQNRFFIEYIKPYYDKKYDLSSDSLTESIVNWLKDGFDYVLKTETVKFIDTEKTNKEGLIKKETLEKKALKVEVEAFKNKHGGYAVSSIEEYSLIDKKWVEVKSEKNTALVYYKGTMIYFKRGAGNWIYRPLIYQDYSNAYKAYRYTSPYGETKINDTFTTITFYDTNKKYIYTIGKPDKNINPQ